METRVRRRSVTPEKPVVKKKRRLNKKQLIVVVPCLLLVGFLFFNIAKSGYDAVVTKGKNGALEAEIDSLYYEKQKLLDEKNSLDDDKAMEEQAKEALGLIKGDEQVLLLEDQLNEGQ